MRRFCFWLFEQVLDEAVYRHFIRRALVRPLDSTGRALTFRHRRFVAVMASDSKGLMILGIPHRAGIIYFLSMSLNI